MTGQNLAPIHVSIGSGIDDAVTAEPVYTADCQRAYDFAYPDDTSGDYAQPNILIWRCEYPREVVFFNTRQEAESWVNDTQSEYLDVVYIPRLGQFPSARPGSVAHRAHSAAIKRARKNPPRANAHETLHGFLAAFTRKCALGFRWRYHPVSRPDIAIYTRVASDGSALVYTIAETWSSLDAIASLTPAPDLHPASQIE